jgi:hypothetical protein
VKTTTLLTRLHATSSLRARVLTGLAALAKTHRKYVDQALRPSFDDSLDVDEAFRAQAASSHRWDYLLGVQETAQIVGLEPHSASTGEVGVVISKKKASMEHLRSHLDTKHISAWFWVASGRVDFAPFETAIRRLDQAGIQFVGGVLKKKHLRP